MIHMIDVEESFTTVSSSSSSSRSHTMGLLMTGFTMGLLHVVAGPDHLSALATLSVGSSWKAMTLGIRWGLGHSTGLIVVAAIFIALKGELDLRALGRYCDFLVGIFMVLLGIHSVMDSFISYNEKRSKKDSRDDSSKESDRPSIYVSIQSRSSESNLTRYSNNNSSLLPTIDMHDPITQRLVSFAIGLLHGVAGPGGILGVLPAVEMRSWKSSFIYLGSFVVMSTFSMGMFAALYGEVTKRIGSTAESMELALRIFSASMSITVGITWLVLSFMGKLDEIFH